jgi:hypothetical protein
MEQRASPYASTRMDEAEKGVASRRHGLTGLHPLTFLL